MVFLSYKKRRDSLGTRAAVLIFFLEPETFGVAVHEIHQNREIRVFIVEMTLMLFEPFFVLVTMLQSLLRHLKNHYR